MQGLKRLSLAIITHRSFKNMIDSRPLICTSLHPPPDSQPFLRIHEISLLILLPSIDRLRLALEATQDINPEATQGFYETRNILREELQKVFLVLQVAQEVAERYGKVLKALEEKEPTQSLLYEVNLAADGGKDFAKDGQQALSVFRRELEKAVERVTTTTGVKDKKGSKSSLNSAKNIQSVSDILTAINECNGLLQRCHDQFGLLEMQTRNENAIDSDPPSEEELQVMRAKWETFFDTVKGVWMQGFEIANEFILPTSDPLKNAPETRKPKQNIPLWCRALFQRPDERHSLLSGNALEVPGGLDAGSAVVTPPTSSASSHKMQSVNTFDQINTTDGVEAPENAGNSNVVLSPNSPTLSKNSRIPFWRKIFQRTNQDNLTRHHQDVSGKLQARDHAPDISIPPPKATFWGREFSCYTFQ